ncbi:MAG: four helix bundle protein [Paludibacteraceae bacterium]|nr:four helix bundle protein [Paludibacteraceae bacterium]
MHNFRKLQIWIESMDLVDAIYDKTKSFPRQEVVGLVSQMQRAAVSVPSNIAEGSGKSNKDFARFLSISVGSLFELETQVLIAERRGYLDKDVSELLINKIIKLERMINTFRLQLDPQKTPLTESI